MIWRKMLPVACIVKVEGMGECLLKIVCKSHSIESVMVDLWIDCTVSLSRVTHWSRIYEGGGSLSKFAL